VLGPLRARLCRLCSQCAAVFPDPSMQSHGLVSPRFLPFSS
jgi:hypothetical protein